LTYRVKHYTLLASCRAGNVIGGGDWAQDRLIPDIVKAKAKGEEVLIRNPNATRPWQHVLDSLSGYMLLGQKLLEKEKIFAKAWNFGPSDEESISVAEVVERMQKFWLDLKVKFDRAPQLHEARFLKLDCSQAHNELHWKPTWTKEEIFQKTAIWYRDFIESQTIQSSNQIDEYVNSAKKKQMIWTK
jgi:CDP-glucose 4,6-dehydratase